MPSDKSTSCPTPEKWTYDSRVEAKESAKRKNRAKFLRVYKCRCGKWHLTKKTRRSPIRGKQQKFRGNQ